MQIHHAQCSGGIYSGQQAGGLNIQRMVELFSKKETAKLTVKKGVKIKHTFKVGKNTHTHARAHTHTRTWGNWLERSIFSSESFMIGGGVA